MSRTMSLIYKNSFITLYILFVQWCFSYGACPTLTSTNTLNVTCKHNDKTLYNCNNPMEGTEAYLTCNMFYEEATLEANPKRLCREGRWDGPIPQCYPICGMKRVGPSSNGEEDQNKLLDYPWHVGIYENKEFLGGGTLIAMNIVLTARTCVTIYVQHYHHGERVPRPIGNISVGSGKYYLEYDDNRDKFAQYSTVHELHFSDRYDQFADTNLDNIDMAIIVLTDPYLPSQVVLPVCLNFDFSSYNSLLEDSGILPGWELKSDANQTEHYSGVLKAITVLYIPHNKCKSKISILYQNLFTLDKICGKNLGGTNVTISCIFNTGGGMVLKNKVNNRYYIIGILSTCPLKLSNTIIPIHPNISSLYTAIFDHQSFVENCTTNIEMKNCVLPNHPQRGEYSIILKENGTFEYEFGHTVPSHTEITLICDLGYYGLTQYHCSKNGEWNPALSGCTINASHQASSPSDNSSTFNYNYIILIVVTILIFLALVALILYKLKYKEEWEIRREIKLAGLYHFRNGNLKRFNPELEIGDQAELLPYNNNFEFPQEKLKLGKQLGSGAFGIVTQADAFGIIANEEKTTVAVKTAKNITDNIQIKALISELKIMVHLGQHLNVVNLLGACTQNITKRELLVIVEYCQYGNLYNYLLLNRENYKDQIDHFTEHIGYSPGTKDLANILAVPDNLSVRPPETDLKKSTCLNSITNSASKNSSNNIQSELSSTSNENYKETVIQLCTKDLVSWSFQVARGMEYLFSRKIVHGDLAARNILLADNNIVKICDFGLAKRMYYQSLNYIKQQDCPLPLKWMAIESIRDRAFSTQSDVWSFGIVLWEFFSLAQTPYPGMEADERLYYKLLDGYKMESPPYAPKEMYKIMCDCWSFNPASRPSFNELASRVGLMLEENIRQHYIDLNKPYFEMNKQRLKKNETDYLEMLSSSGYEQTSIPHHNFVNIGFTNNEHPVEAPGYLYLTTTDPAINTAVNSLNEEEVSPSLPNEHSVANV